MKWTICWKTDNSYLDTLVISGNGFLFYPSKVKILSKSVNQPVTNNVLFNKNNLVGTSETIRPLSSNLITNTEMYWNQ